MGVVVYKSTDASAPTLQGIVGGAYSSGWTDGSFLQLLRKVLVTGYGSGAQAAGAGWTQSFQGTSEGVFKQGAGCGFYLHVLDDGSMTAGAKEANMYGAEVMSAISTGTGKFPTAAQKANGILMRKSDTADTTTRWWMIIADASTFYIFVNPGASTSYLAAFMFGNFHTLRASDAYNCMIMGRITSASTDTVTNETVDTLDSSSAIFGVLNGHYIARGYNQQGTSVNVGKTGSLFSFTASSNYAGAYGLNFPNPTDALMYFNRIYITDSVTAPINSIRGYLRGMYAMQHVGNSVPFDYTILGTGTLIGKTLRVLGERTGINLLARYTMEVSDTWDS
jgi:hypothetical protein